MALDRTNRSLIGRWWWRVDRGTLACLFTLMVMGLYLVMAGSPAVAAHYGYGPMHYVVRHGAFLVLGLLSILAISMLPLSWVRPLAAMGLAGSLALMAILPFTGSDIKGASRWISLGYGLTLQPSEFAKPFMAVVTAWCFSEHARSDNIRWFWCSIGLLGLAIGLLLLQPDIGMTLTILAIWCGQLFLAGFPLSWFIMGGVMVCGVAIFSYVNFPHVAERIDGFMSENTGYQVSRSLEAYQSGGLFGTGPGEGTVKRHLPDAHTDFIFAVAGEEFGLIACGFIVLVMAGVVFFSVRRIWAVKDMFILLAASGLLLQFSLQSLVNIGVTLNLLPTKGMTLPFISYGGSSTLALAIMAGFLLIFTRKRFGGE